jgi:hypothetical protein
LDIKIIEEKRIQQKGHIIRIDDEVWEKLDEKALELGIVYSSRNQVLRTILGLQIKVRKPGGRPRRHGRPPTR